MANGLTNAHLGRVLADAANHLDDPSPHDLTGAVLARLESPGEALGAPSSRSGRRRTARFVLASAVVAVIVTGILAFSPASREAVARWLGMRGIDVEQQDGAAPSSRDARLALGERVSLAEATRRVSFDVLVPPRRVGTPDEVYVADTPSGGRVSLLYGPTAELPPAAPTGVGMLLTEFQAQVAERIIEKGVPDDTRLVPVSVDGSPGLWFAGAPHTLTFTDEEGAYFADDARLAGSTLVWERGPLTLRLESALSRQHAIRLASSLVVTSAGR
jgi:hypothetical protein